MPANRLTQTDASLGNLPADTVTITVNGASITAQKGENVLEAARRAGIDIPYFCYHPRLSRGDAANCRMCLVEVGMPGPDGSIRTMPKPQTSCTLPAAEGMVIQTETPALAKDRKGILEFLLINHPLDCPVCDRGGECPLQNNTLFYGAGATRFVEEKRHFPKAYPLSEHVVFDRERCIHCARCTRFAEDISGDAQLGFLKRGADMEVGTFARTAYSSRFSGNVIELCPVGALLSREYRFKARPWDLVSQRSVCSLCSNGCNVKLDVRRDEIQRVNARINEDVNEEWTCDLGKFGHGYVNAEERLTSPMLRDGDGFREIPWAEAVGLLAERFGAAGAKSAAIGGQRCTNEDAYLLQKLFREQLGSADVDSRVRADHMPSAGPLLKRFGHNGMADSIASLERMKAVLVIGGDLAAEQPILFLRVRKGWRFGGARIVSAVAEVPAETTHVANFADVSLVHKPGAELALLHGLCAAAGAAPAGWTVARAAEEAGVAAADIEAAAAALKGGQAAIIAGSAIAEADAFDALAEAMGALAAGVGSPGHVNVPGTRCNTQGALDMGLLPDSGPGYTPAPRAGRSTTAILKAAAEGAVEALWIVGAELVGAAPDPAATEAALKGCRFTVVSELRMNDTARCADLVLPAASFAEKDGTFTNCERRVQRIHRAFAPRGESRPDWEVFAEVLAELGGDAPWFSPGEVYAEITRTVAGYDAAPWQSLGEDGVRLGPIAVAKA